MSPLAFARRPSWRVVLVRCLCSACLGVRVAAAAPPLPTPCLVNVCGNNASSFVQYGTASSSVNGTTMNVTQTSSQAILNWANFNIANGYTVNFKQPSSTAEVLNKIWSANPSVIAGALNANGEVYLYNQNGIIFSNGAQVNVGSLVASTLAFAPVTGSSDPDALFKAGILSQDGTTSQTQPAVFSNNSSSGTAGAVTVGAGATLTASDGGRIMLLGSAVTNQGTITTPNGQAILAAGNTVYLAASTDPSLRGLLIEVNSGGTVTNSGQISAPTGNVTMAGMVVNQEGVISATTSVGENGSIYLVAGDTSSSTNFYDSGAAGFGTMLPNKGGQLTLASGSVTEVLPDSTDTSTISIANLSEFVPSQVDLVGQTVALLGSATVRAPGGTVRVNAATNPYAQFDTPTEIDTSDTAGEIYIDSGSTIDVSGLTNVSVPVTNNIIQVTLEGTDLQDDPLLRNGFLHGTTVTLNVSQCITNPAACSTLFNAQPYVDEIGLGINQMLTAAGSIQLNATGSVVTRAGSTLNVSGGSIAYQGGYADSTTELLGANGLVYNINDAPSTIQYVGLANSYSYTDPTWGTSTNFNSKSYYAGYTQGANAGSIAVEAQQIYLGGTMSASTVAGPYQRGVSSLATGGTLQVGCESCVNSNDNSEAEYQAPAVTFENGATDTLGGDFTVGSVLPSSLQTSTILSPSQLTASGFNHILVYSNGTITLPADTNISLAANGTLSLISDAGIQIDGNVTAPGGTVSLATAWSGSGTDAPVDLVIGNGADIDVSGTWTNDSPIVTRQPGTGPIVLNGGTVSLIADGNLVLGNDTSINVSGGGWINSGGKLTEGAAGSIALEAIYQSSLIAAYTGTVQLGAGVSLLGDSLEAGKGGTLAINSGSITIGDASAGTAGELLLAPSFFNNRGFASYELTGYNDVNIGSAAAASVVINPIQENLVFTNNADLERTGAPLASFTTLESLPESERSPVSLTFAGVGYGLVDTGSVTLWGNASIETDPQGSVSLTTGKAGSIDVFGSIIAPAGDITLQLAGSGEISNPDGLGYIADQEILLGPHAVLDAAGYAQINTLDALGYAQGSILAGGTVTLQAFKGYVVTDAGSLIDVDGAAGVLDLSSTNSLFVKPTVVASNAGSIDIEAREGIVLQGALSGEAAAYNGQTVSGAGGGSLTIGLDLYDYESTSNNEANINGILYSLTPRTLTLTGQPAASLFVRQSGTADISTSTLENGGFDSIALKSSDVIAVSGDVSLSAKASLTLDAPLLQGGTNSSLTLSSAYVMLGNYFDETALGTGTGSSSGYFSTTTSADGITTYNNPNASNVLSPSCSVTCSATLTVNAQDIDIRGVSGWAGFASETLVSSGDIRLTTAANYFSAAPALETPSGDTSDPLVRAGLTVTGNLTLQAQQVYPTTNTDFTVTAASSVTVLPSSGTAMTPLSAEGILTINAPTITQDGVLRAPLGWITLNGESVTLGAGSLTSVSADGLTIPYGSTLNGQQWTYSPDSYITDVVTAPLAKTINLAGTTVSIDSGAKVDLSGGGDLLAYEWITGEGGSKDVLASGGTYQYAIIPTLGSQFAAIDAQYAQGSKATGNQIIYVSGVPGLAAGYYALLPARYAVLPGAYAIEVVKSDSNVASGTSIEQADGSYEVAARLGTAGTNILDSQTSTVIVASSAVVGTHSEYETSSANTYFSSTAAASGTAVPSLPADAGALQISATTSLALNGTIEMASGSYTSGSGSTATTVEGRGGDVSIIAPNIEVVDAASSTASGSSGVLQVNAQSLNDLGAQTIVLGATLANTAAGEVVTVGTTNVELDNTSVALSAPQIILAAQNQIALDAGSKVDATGTLSGTTPSALVFAGGGALIAASSGAAVPLTASSTNPPVSGGQLSVGSQASVQAAGSLLLYSTSITSAATDVTLSAPEIALYSSRVNIGDVPTGGPAPGGLTLTSQLLNQFTGLTQLVIGSTSTIDLYGAVDLGTSNPLQNLTLDAWAIDGYGAGNKILQAGSITLQNSNSGSMPTDLYASAPSGTGSLALRAPASSSSGSGEITLGSGDKLINGFSSVTLSADSAILAQGTGTLSLSGTHGALVPLTLQAGELIAGSASNQTISTAGAVTIAQAATTGVTLPTAPLGGELSIEGGSITQDGTIDLPAGILTLHAISGDVVLGQGSVTSVAGSSEDFVVTNAVAAGGQLSLVADAGNVTLASGSTLDVAGAASSGGTVVGDAGSLTISAPQGQFAYAGSTLEGGAPSGALQGNFTLDVGSGLSGSGFSSLASMLSGSGFTGAVSLRTRTDSTVDVSGTVAAGSFTLTADQGSIDVSGTINTNGGNTVNPDGGDIALWAQNNLTLESSAQLLANAVAAGPTAVNGSALASAGGDVTLGSESGSIVLNGGKISMLGTAASSDGTLTLRAPRSVSGLGIDIDLPASGSTVEVDTHKPVIVEGFQVYNTNELGSADSGCNSSGSSCASYDVNDTNGLLFLQASSWLSQTQSAGLSTALAQAFSNDLGASNPVQIEVRPGIEVQSNGDLTVDPSSGVWDLDGWAVALGTPVNITLRAAGNLIFNASLSDGFTNPNNGNSVSNWSFGESTSGQDSASYTLTAGADLGSANPLAVLPPVTINDPSLASSAATAGNYTVVPNTGNVIIEPGVVIRTGTGNIDIAAGGDVLLGYTSNGLDSYGNLEVQVSDPLSSVIYTAGKPSSALSPKSYTGGIVGSFPTAGGNISVTAADDIRSAVSQQLVTDWLWRSGDITDGSVVSNTAWSAVFSKFEQGIGALGGGNIDLQAGGAIVDVSAVIPTTGELLGAAGAPASISNLVLNGGGYLQVQAGGDIQGGVFENDWGNATISAGGALTGGATLQNELTSAELSALNTAVAGANDALATQTYPILLQGAGSFDVSGRQGVEINFVGNSTTLPETQANAKAAGGSSNVAYFYTYTADTTLDVSSSGGDVVFLNTVLNLPVYWLNGEVRPLNVYEQDTYNLIYPPTLNVAALSGDISFGTLLNTEISGTNLSSLYLYPSATGNLSLLANGSITGVGDDVKNPFAITMYETDPSLWPSVVSPVNAADTVPATTDLPQTPLHENDSQSTYVVADTGSISPATLTFPKQADVIAGQNIYDLTYNGKNLNPDEVTLIQAGGDISYTLAFTPITDVLVPNLEGITLAGPGYLEVLAGGALDLGDSNGIKTTGALSDTRLPSTGAEIVAGAGFGTTSSGGLREPADQAFIKAYLAPDSSGNPSAYANDLISYVLQVDPAAGYSPSYSAALSAFEALSPAQQLPLLAQVFMEELSATGLAHTQDGTSYARGYTAINTLFPTTDSRGNTLNYSGDINMFYSQIKTEEGGNIDLLAPGGSVVVGVPDPSSNLNNVKATQAASGASISGVANLGVLVLGQGAIQGFASDSFEVNSSRILTLEGGDIILWATNGNIDAGIGAKSASAAPPPIVETDQNGNVFVNPINDVSGSGIGQLLTGPDESAGLVNLIAPNGVVNAGDAGIRVAGNLNIAAVEVIGASNIQVSGTATGVPTSAAGALSGALSGANSLSNAGENAVAQLTQDLNASTNYQALTEGLTPTFIVVKLFCLGVECKP